MKRFLTPAALICLLFAATPVLAASRPTDANAFGIELCPQSICGSAIFTGILQGTVAGVDTQLGTFTVAVQHDDLPAPGQTAAITGGVFQLRVGLRTIRGTILSGSLTATPTNTFLVSMELLSTTGQTLQFVGVLNHNTFPPTIVGHIVSVD